MKKSEELECDFVSTGHYARIERDNGTCKLRESADRRKDQSYVLFSLNARQIKKSLLPIGSIPRIDKIFFISNLLLALYFNFMWMLFTHML
ncbi:hypothetical protein KKA08_05190, partial [bacterium]|nr:hypothetical protein [bacterium]